MAELKINPHNGFGYVSDLVEGEEINEVIMHVEADLNETCVNITLSTEPDIDNARYLSLSIPREDALFLRNYLDTFLEATKL